MIIVIAPSIDCSFIYRDSRDSCSCPSIIILNRRTLSFTWNHLNSPLPLSVLVGSNNTQTNSTDDDDEESWRRVLDPRYKDLNWMNERCCSSHLKQKSSNLRVCCDWFPIVLLYSLPERWVYQHPPVIRARHTQAGTEIKSNPEASQGPQKSLPDGRSQQ